MPFLNLAPGELLRKGAECTTWHLNMVGRVQLWRSHCNQGFLHVLAHTGDVNLLPSLGENAF